MPARDPDNPTTEVGAVLDLPGDVVVQGTVFVVAYFDADGNTKYGWATRGEMSLATGVGLLRIVEAHMLQGAIFGDTTANDDE